MCIPAWLHRPPASYILLQFVAASFRSSCSTFRCLAARQAGLLVPRSRVRFLPGPRDLQRFCWAAVGLRVHGRAYTQLYTRAVGPSLRCSFSPPRCSSSQLASARVMGLAIPLPCERELDGTTPSKSSKSPLSGVAFCGATVPSHSERGSCTTPIRGRYDDCHRLAAVRKLREATELHTTGDAQRPACGPLRIFTETVSVSSAFPPGPSEVLPVVPSGEFRPTRDPFSSAIQV